MTEKEEALLKLAKAYGLSPEELMKKLELASSAPDAGTGTEEDPDGWKNLPFQWKEPSIGGVSAVIDDFIDSIGSEEAPSR